jgi:hypothetical protein
MSAKNRVAQALSLSSLLEDAGTGKRVPVPHERVVLDKA